MTKKFSRRSFNNNVKKFLPDFRIYEDLVYLWPAEHIMSGLLLEVTPFSFYIWQCYFPLFEKWEFFNLGFGNRISSINRSDLVNSDQIWAVFLDLIQSNIDLIKKLNSIEFFVEYVKFDFPLRNLRVLRAMASAFILRGDSEEALKRLREMTKLQIESEKEFVEDTEELVRLLVSGNLYDAQNVVLRWEASTRDRFQLEGIGGAVA